MKNWHACPAKRWCLLIVTWCTWKNNPSTSPICSTDLVVSFPFSCKSELTLIRAVHLCPCKTLSIARQVMTIALCAVSTSNTSHRCYIVVIILAGKPGFDGQFSKVESKLDTCQKHVKHGVACFCLHHALRVELILRSLTTGFMINGILVMFRGGGAYPSCSFELE